MTPPAPTFRSARAVLGFPSPHRDPQKDEVFIQAVKRDFPHLVARQMLPPQAPPNLAHVELASSSSRLTLSAAAAEFTVEFFGDHTTDHARALAYVHEKMKTVLEGLVKAGGTPTNVGIIVQLNFSLASAELGAASRQILEGHVRGDIDASIVQDAGVRVAVRVGGSHYATFNLNNYEVRGLGRPLMPGVPVVINPWEGVVEDHGIELTIDVNDRLGELLRREHAPVDAGRLASTYAVLEQAVIVAGPAFVADGTLDTRALQADSHTDDHY